MAIQLTCIIILEVHSLLDSGTSFILCVKSGGMPATHSPNLKSELHKDTMSLSPGLQPLMLGELYSSCRSRSRTEEHKVNSPDRLLSAECFVCKPLLKAELRKLLHS